METSTHLFNPRKLEELASSQLFLSHCHTLSRATSQNALQITRLWLQPSLNKLRWIICKRLKECLLQMGIVQRLREQSDLLDETNKQWWQGKNEADVPSVFFRMAWRTRFYTSSSSLVNVATDSLDIWTEVPIRFFRAISSIFISTSHADGRSGGGTVGSRRYCKTIGSEPPKCRFTSSGICWNAIVSEPKIYTKHDNDQAEMKRTP